jgi:hypothetical protein
MSDQDIVTEAPRNIAVFTLSVAQSVRLLTALVHDPDLPYRTREGAARLLLPHLRAERDRLLQERILAQQAQDSAQRSPSASATRLDGHDYER